MDRSIEILRPSELRAASLPAFATAAFLFLLGSLDIRTPLWWILVLLAGTAALAFVLARLPLLLFWLVPVSMSWFAYMPVLHYEALVILLALMLALEALHRFEARRIALDPVEWCYLVFLLSLLPGIAGAVSLWRYFGAVKLYALGLLAFEVARRGVRHFGRQAMLLGPLFFVAITTIMLLVRVQQSDVPGFRGVALRTVLSELGWGSSNYVAAVMVLCLPAMVLAIRLSPAGSRRRWGAVATMVSSLVSPLLTSSRGGFLLSLVYLLSLAARIRRSFAALAMVAAATLAASLVVSLTPFGQGLIGRFTDTRSLDSVVARVLIWQAAWSRGLANLPFGVGAGQGLLTEDRLHLMDPHNFLLTLLGELGLPALVVWLCIFTVLWRCSLRLLAQSDTAHVGEAMRATLALAFANMLFEPTLGGNLYHLLFWWLIGIFYGFEGRAENRAGIAAAG